MARTELLPFAPRARPASSSITPGLTRQGVRGQGFVWLAVGASVIAVLSLAALMLVTAMRVSAYPSNDITT